MARLGRLRASITFSVLLYLLLQGVIFGAATLVLELSGRLVGIFGAVAAAYHAALLGFLLWRAEDLRAVDGSAVPDSINLACHLTLLRFSATPTLVMLVAASDRPLAAAFVVPLAALSFATDFADGRVARALSQRTVMGQYLDSSTDYVMLLSLGAASAALLIIPWWYAALLLGRLVLFALAMGVLSLTRRKVEPETTFLGKTAVFAAMATYALQLSRRYGLPLIGDRVVVLIAEIATAALLVLSIADKVIYIARKLRETP